MTMPPPPPDRMHLQYQSAPPPQPGPQQPQMAGPGGAYGPMQQSPQQPMPGQMPPARMMMNKPGTITGIQVILWLFLAISAIGNLLSIISMVEFFNPFSLIGLAFGVYSTIQSLASGVHITRGKRWAWIWSIISSILGLALTGTGIVYGIIFWDTGGDIMLLITCPLAALYATLLGLLCTKSARQWILMHRVQRGEVQAPGMVGATGMGGMPGTAPMGGTPGMNQMGGMAEVAGGVAEPQRPETKPGVVTFTVVLLGLLTALAAWHLYGFTRFMVMMTTGPDGAAFRTIGTGFGRDFAPVILSGAAAAMMLVFGLVSAIGLNKGRAWARVLTIVWTSVLILGFGFLEAIAVREYLAFREFLFPPQATSVLLTVLRDVGCVVLLIVVFIAVLTPGVRAWTPRQPSAPIIMMVPMGQPQMQQPGPYGQPQQSPYPQQQQQAQYQPPQQQPPYGRY